MKWLVVLAACSAADAGAPKQVKSRPMAGPFPTIGAACAKAPACGFTVMDESGNQSAPPTAPDCTFVTEQDSDASNFDHGDTRLVGIPCAIPKGARGSDVQYYLYVKRDDGWWRSVDRVLDVNYNDKYCAGKLSADWDDRGAHLSLGVGCISCNKQGDDDFWYDALLAIDRKAPVYWDPIILGQHERSKLRDDGDKAEAKACNTPPYDAVLKETWKGDDLVLTGPAKWHSIATDKPGFHVWYGPRGDVPSSAGTYRLVR